MSTMSETYKEVAKRCNEYEPKDGCECYHNRLENGESISCTNCGHFEHEHCNIDLYDKIVENHNLK
ncbi:hypothetical protein [Anaerolentibacter hominis]|uniref:hypothetical protein n=1 Tax=Anaerolentibacter hominis TaxID=3079009 RepID=UPI0031B7F8D9